MSPTVYTARTADGHFVAFWKEGDDTIAYFQPDSYYQRHFRKSLAEWGAQRASYLSRDNDFDQHEDIVNAAWHYHGMEAGPLVRAGAAPSKMEPGIFYPRIWRGGYDQNGLQVYNVIDPRQVYGYKHVQSIVAASSLFDYLLEIFRYIEPSEENKKSFGHKTRELLILVCTEVESAWRAVLVENSENQKANYTTNDYVRVKEPLNLDRWAVGLFNYPNLPPFRPFEGWDPESATKSLPWYDAYNAVKHDREAQFSQATLENLLNATAALHIMQLAQWGPETYSRWHGNESSPFGLIAWPEYPVSEMYIPALDEPHGLVPGRYFSAP